MGQQQLLLIVVGILIVGISIIIGISMFTASAVEAKRDNITNELINLASLAQQHYRKPQTMGGGNRAFDNSHGGLTWTIPPSLVTTGNGWFSIENISTDQVVILATGNEVVTGNDSVKVQITVSPNDFQVTIIK
ncbi:MAG: hypothetical protein KJ571_15640 [Bacteroidetes bacterium]|nr:hypothetical protein [Bacteroidota bacterium]